PPGHRRLVPGAVPDVAKTTAGIALRTGQGRDLDAELGGRDPPAPDAAHADAEEAALERAEIGFEPPRLEGRVGLGLVDPAVGEYHAFRPGQCGRGVGDPEAQARGGAR